MTLLPNVMLNYIKLKSTIDKTPFETLDFVIQRKVEICEFLSKKKDRLNSLFLEFNNHSHMLLPCLIAFRSLRKKINRRDYISQSDSPSLGNRFIVF